VQEHAFAHPTLLTIQFSIELRPDGIDQPFPMLRVIVSAALVDLGAHRLASRQEPSDAANRTGLIVKRDMMAFLAFGLHALLRARFLISLVELKIDEQRSAAKHGRRVRLDGSGTGNSEFFMVKAGYGE
jgi:hypothetical protein